jgi:tetratricopeptide (TPR) repeat protein
LGRQGRLHAVGAEHLERALAGAPVESSSLVSVWTADAKQLLDAALRASIARGASLVEPDDLRAALRIEKPRWDVSAPTFAESGKHAEASPAPLARLTCARSALEGSGHRQLVEVLLSGYETVIRENRPAWFSLEANLGWGKTRVVQEFYARLAGQQSSPPYWPPSIVGEEEVGITARRKFVHPPREKAARGAQLEWFWWGISCAFRDGLPISALVQDLERFSERRAALEQRVAALSTKSRRAKRALGEHREELAEAAVEDVIATTLSLAGAVVPGLSLLGLLGKLGVGHFRRHSVESMPGDLLDDLVPALVEIAQAGIPLILFIEDLHDADDTLVSLVGRLLAIEQAPVMIVTTACRGILEQQHRPTSKLHETVTASRCRRIDCERDLQQLTVEELARIASTCVPSADAASCELLAGTYSNPYELEIVCCFGAMRRAVERGTLTRADLEGLPSGLEGLVRHLWDELPGDVRLALGVAGELTPEAVSARYGFRDARWTGELLRRVLEQVPWLVEELPTSDDVLERACAQYGWVTTIAGGLYRFTDPSQLAVARAAFTAEYGSGRERRDLLTAAAVVAESMIDPLQLIDDDADRLPTNVDRLLVALAMDGWTTWSPAIARAAQRVCKDVLAAPGAADLDAIQQICVEGAMAEENVWFDQLFSFHLALGHCLLQKRDGEGAVQQFAAVLEALESVGWPDTSDVARIRADLGTALEVSERPAAALRQLEPAAQYLTAVFGLGTPESREVRVQQTRLLSELGRWDDAIAGLQELEHEVAAQCGPESLDALDARAALAAVRCDSGQSAGLDQLHEILSQYVQLVGPLAPDTLACRGSLSGALFGAGRYAEAAEQAGHIVTALTNALGPAAPATLVARCEFGFALAHTGEVEQGRQILADVLVDARRELGGNARTTIIAQIWLDVTEGLAGNTARAVERLEDLWPIVARIAGSDSELARSVQSVIESLQEHGEPFQPAAPLLGSFGSASKGRQPIVEHLDPQPRMAVQWPVIKPSPSSADAQSAIACALANDGWTLARLGRDGHALLQYEELLGRFTDVDQPRAQLAVAMGLIGKASLLFGAGEQQSALLTVDQLVARFAEHRHPRVRRAAAQGLIYKGMTLAELQRHEQALSTYEGILESFAEDPEPAISEGVVAVAQVGRGVALGSIGRFEEAISQFDDTALRFEQASDGMARTQAAGAILNKALAFCRVQRTHDGLDAFDDVVARFGDSEEPGCREGVARALLQKGIALNADSTRMAEIACYEEVIARFEGDEQPEIQKQVARAHLCQGESYLRLGKLQAAAEHFSAGERLAATLGGRDARLTRAQSRACLAKTLALLGAIKEAVAILEGFETDAADVPGLEAIAKEAVHIRRGLEAELQMHSEGRPNQSGVQSATNDAAALLVLSKDLTRQARFDEAAALCQLVVERLPAGLDPRLTRLIREARLNKGHAYRAAEDYEQALAAYDELAATYKGAEDDHLHDLVVEAVIRKAEQLQALGQIQDAVATLEDITCKPSMTGSAQLSEVATQALVNLAHLLEMTGRTGDAAPIYHGIAERHQRNRDPFNLPHVAFALVRAGHIAAQAGDYQAALSWFGRVTPQSLQGADPRYLARSCSEALLGTAESLLRLDRPAQALQQLSTLDDSLDVPTDPPSAMLLARSLALRAWALNNIKRHTDALTAAGRIAGIEANSDGQRWRVVRSEPLSAAPSSARRLPRWPHAMERTTIRRFGETSNWPLNWLRLCLVKAALP